MKRGAEHGYITRGSIAPEERAPVFGPLIERRRFIQGLSLALLAAPRAAHAQKPAKVPHVGILGVGPVPSSQDQVIE